MAKLLDELLESRLGVVPKESVVNLALSEPNATPREELRAMFPGNAVIRPQKDLAMVKEMSLRTQHYELPLTAYSIAVLLELAMTVPSVVMSPRNQGYHNLSRLCACSAND